MMIAWVAAQQLTPALSSFGGELAQTEALLFQGCIAAGMALALTLAYPNDARALFAYSRAMWLYLLVPIAVVVLVIRVGPGVDVLEPLGWVAAAVVWRWFLFGMLQRRLSEWFPPGTVLLTSAALLASWLYFGAGMISADVLRFPFAILIALLVGTLITSIPSGIMLVQKNVHVLVALNLVASTLIV
ncbi:hypothetical protein [Microbacterium sp. 8M]|uniref:hypothetical protein n=1 Tax=Microbacterium sp. 8M TaxID=2653153 RepID=UPI001359F872|nr:hypothetical protein [Microbacterium sp. 8M]